MGTLKPDTFYGQALTALYHDVGKKFQITRSNLDLNLQYLLRRYEKEGLGFLTKTLPRLGKAFDASLRDGRIHPMPVKTDRRGSLPLCLKGLIGLVFESDGTLKVQPNIDAIASIRQLCFMFYKLEGEYPQELVDECVRQFVAVDKELTHCDNITPEITSILMEASDVISEVFRTFDPGDITPRPGPGQTSDRRPHWARYEPGVLYNRVHQAYPYYRYFFSSSNHLLDSVHRYRSLPRAESGISTLAVVPKDSRGPRIICMEPSEYMWMQQGLGRAMMEHIESHPLTRGHVNFSDQTINGSQALMASSSGLLATLDMKEASDRISRNLVEYLFQGVPSLQKKLLALSTPEIKLPSGEIIRTNKFAPMGSALCFPVMSIVHFALLLSCLRHERVGVSRKALAKHLYVYGDDIICHVQDVEHFLREFPIYGLKFNRDKSFFVGKFRESCGVDAYDGKDVTPQRIKTIRFSKSSGTLLQTHLAYYHGLRSRGYTTLCSLWRNRIQDTWGNLPYVSEDSGVPGWVATKDHVKLFNSFKWSNKLQTWTKRVRVVKTRPDCSMVGSWERFLRTQVHCVVGNSARISRRDHAYIAWTTKSLSGL